MKSTIVRTAAVALAVVGLSMAPAAASVPGSHELPGGPTPVVTQPVVSTPGGGEITPQVSFCTAVPWWIWCRI
ncbi:hypothetical protein M3148_03450 [Georgenia satyanarayanai]|uniref:hypothetical protein n=1 Tax=Georgenia satyanarayanai TaxID=860221 RepID=UPI00203F9B74|nr:hypothetical protein [Georgenia satyanarayanai]MCM3660054.1 hypothetical protein [Georgenia satyanarayanai]